MEHDPLLRAYERTAEETRNDAIRSPLRRDRIRAEVRAFVLTLVGRDWHIAETRSLGTLHEASDEPGAQRRAHGYRKLLLATLLNRYPDELRAIYARHP